MKNRRGIAAEESPHSTPSPVDINLFTEQAFDELLDAVRGSAAHQPHLLARSKIKTASSQQLVNQHPFRIR
jgi:hypothetical protein